VALLTEVLPTTAVWLEGAFFIVVVDDWVNMVFCTYFWIS
jgi:hypothetical protein